MGGEVSIGRVHRVRVGRVRVVGVVVMGMCVIGCNVRLGGLVVGDGGADLDRGGVIVLVGSCLPAMRSSGVRGHCAGGLIFVVGMLHGVARVWTRSLAGGQIPVDDAALAITG